MTDNATKIIDAVLDVLEKKLAEAGGKLTPMEANRLLAARELLDKERKLQAGQPQKVWG